MKRILLTVFGCCMLLSATESAQAFVRYEEKNPQKVTELKVTGYINYAPFGYVDHPESTVYGSFHTLFQPMLDTFAKEANLKLQYDLLQKDVDSLAQKVRQGDIDFFLGAYYQTEMFKGLHLVFPAALYNPITVFMLPNRIDEVKSTDDLKKLKGIRNTKEVFTDFVERKVAEFKPQEADSAYQMFEKLFTKEVDYIITSYYNGMLEAARLGLRQQVAPAKQTLWNIPVFIGISKTSRNREMISRWLTRYLSNKSNLDILQQSLQQTINEFEKKYEGTVPPTFGLENLPENKDIAETQPETAKSPDGDSAKTPDMSAGEHPETLPDTAADEAPVRSEDIPPANGVENHDNKLDAR